MILSDEERSQVKAKANIAFRSDESKGNEEEKKQKLVIFNRHFDKDADR